MSDFVSLVADEMRRRPELLADLLKRLGVNITQQTRDSLEEWEHDMAIGYRAARGADDE